MNKTMPSTSQPDINETFPGTVKQAFCYVRTQYPELKTDYIEEIKYDPSFVPPVELVNQLRAIHRSMLVKEVAPDCALCFSMEVGDESYVCACRSKIVKPIRERPYLLLKAFIVTSSDLAPFKTTSLAIGTPEDWEALERLKQPTMPVNIRPFNKKSPAYQRFIDVCTGVLKGELSSIEVAWPEHLTSPDVMHNVRIAIQKLPPTERHLKNVAIGLPKDIDLPISMDLYIEQETTNPLPPEPPRRPHETKSTPSIRTDPVWTLQDNLVALTIAIENLKTGPGDPSGLWIQHLWSQTRYMIDEIETIDQRARPGAIVIRRTIRRIRERLDQVQKDCRRSNHWRDLEVQLEAVEADMDRLGRSTRSGHPSRFQEISMRLDSRNARAWVTLIILLCLTVGAFLVQVPRKMTRTPSKEEHIANASGPDLNSGAFSPSQAQPASPVEALVGNYSFVALMNLFPEEMDPEEAKSIAGLYAEMNRRQTGMPDNRERQYIRVEGYNKIATTLTDEQKTWLSTIKPVLVRLALSPQQWATLGPHDRLNQEQWQKILDLSANLPPVERDQEFKTRVEEILTPIQRQIVGLKYR